MANDSLLADSIVSLLTGEADLEVVRLTQREPGNGDQYSVVIIINDGEYENESHKAADLFLNHNTLLVIIISLKSRDIHVYESYQLVNPEMERVIHIVREVGRMNPQKKIEEEMNVKAFRKLTAIVLFQVYVDPLAGNI